MAGVAQGVAAAPSPPLLEQGAAAAIPTHKCTTIVRQVTANLWQHKTQAQAGFGMDGRTKEWDIAVSSCAPADRNASRQRRRHGTSAHKARVEHKRHNSQRRRSAGLSSLDHWAHNANREHNRSHTCITPCWDLIPSGWLSMERETNPASPCIPHRTAHTRTCQTSIEETAAYNHA